MRDVILQCKYLNVVLSLSQDDIEGTGLLAKNNRIEVCTQQEASLVIPRSTKTAMCSKHVTTTLHTPKVVRLPTIPCRIVPLY